MAKINLQQAGNLIAMAMVMAATAVTAAPLPQGVTADRYLGWNGAITIESAEAEAKLVIVPEIGGRIMRYEVMGDNVLWDNPAARGLTIDAERRSILPGGFQTSVGSDTAFLGSMERLEYGVYELATPRDYSATVTSAADILTGLKLEKNIILDTTRGEVGIVQRLANNGSKEITCSIRSRAMCKGGGFVIVPLNKNSRFKAGWTLRRLVEDKGIYDGFNPSHPKIKKMGDLLVIETGGPEERVGVDASAEWVGYVNDRTLFVQYFAYNPQAKYPRGGHTVEIGWDEVVTEIQIFSPEGPLAAGQTLEAPLKWLSMPLKEAVSTAKQARALTGKIPPSPFRPAGK